MSQIERIIWINEKLQNHQPLTITAVMNHFKVSERQVKRDIKRMREDQNAPIIWNADKRCYEYQGSFDQMKFAGQEMILAYVMLEALARNQNYSAVVSQELLKSMTDNIPSNYRKICDRIIYQLPYSQEISPEKFYIICQSMNNRHRLHISYTNNSGKSSERDIEPERLINYEGAWYIIAFDYESGEFRNFNISHIGALVETDTEYDDHKKGYPKMIGKHSYANYEEHLTRYVEGSYGIFKGSATTLCQIQFTGMAANIVRGQKWHSKQVVKRDDENGLVIQFPFSNSTELMGKILGYGVNARPLEPPELVAEWKDKITQLSSLL